MGNACSRTCYSWCVLDHPLPLRMNNTSDAMAQLQCGAHRDVCWSINSMNTIVVKHDKPHSEWSYSQQLGYLGAPLCNYVIYSKFHVIISFPIGISIHGVYSPSFKIISSCLSKYHHDTTILSQIYS